MSPFYHDIALSMIIEGVVLVKPLGPASIGEECNWTGSFGNLEEVLVVYRLLDGTYTCIREVVKTDVIMILDDFFSKNGLTNLESILSHFGFTQVNTQELNSDAIASILEGSEAIV